MSEVLRETAERIRTDQNAVVDAWDLFESGDLKSMLRGHFSVSAVDGGAKLSMRYLQYFRFLDIPDPRRQLRRAKREGYHNYNQIVYGNVYNYGIPELQYGFTKDVYEGMTGAMETAIKGNKYQRMEKMLTGIAGEDRFMAALITGGIRNSRHR
ncbi:MAG TPA: hypothetical protein VFG54_12165 [Prolixibacteraceae bacterium]|nr:hypothetical protein [Prolixibacteraceae bacterium]